MEDDRREEEEVVLRDGNIHVSRNTRNGLFTGYVNTGKAGDYPAALSMTSKEAAHQESVAWDRWMNS